ncbi:hypothetical protein LOC68_01435 [Blastopirellula sp. JC732]|uniref:[acyl-carrier-protein] S-malonyltransferase n=1 Tax=Blastopirellula sediminis TaxID=2894196 RepID=A0A9X1SES4_9BACT|nr:hypothetical protein [Blastopirellula sediminis]MCC9608150.1 hypothetical protein [Blastopirellula sediminis]MCC9627057.1 hypothetical protein [Blastopirellula sediminis]
MPNSPPPFNRLSTTCFAFRGYNFENLGSTPELLAHPEYGPIMRRRLVECGEIASQNVGRKIDLIRRVEAREEVGLNAYADAIALIIGAELAHLDILRELFYVEIEQSQYFFGYSLGEIVALCASGALSVEDAVGITTAMADDTASLAHGCQLAVVFCRKQELPLKLVQQCCIETNQEGDELIGVSAVLSPNSVLLIGEGTALDRCREKLAERLPCRVFFKVNEHRWPPMHTPLIWRNSINTRAAMFMAKMKSGLKPPQPPVLSLVTGKRSYDEINLRDTIYRWVDQPQLLWAVVYETLRSGTETIIHIGPGPNIIPATYHRLADNVQIQTKGSLGSRTLSTFVNRPWLKNLLPERAALLRAPMIQHVMIEEWLLAQKF